jgi:hypothetical protein
MTFEMRAILESKRALRRTLAALSFSEKLRLLEKMRDRLIAISASRESLARLAREKSEGK